MCCFYHVETLFNRYQMMKWNSTMWHTTEMFEGTCVSTTHPHVLYRANKTCPVAGHDLFTSLFTLHTPFLMLCRSLLQPKHVIWDTHLNISCSECYEGIFLFRHSSHESLMTSHSQLTLQLKTIHRCFPLSAHNVYSEVAMATFL